MTTRAAAAEETRARLIEAAIARFAQDGLGASFEAVGADVGVTKGALYHHFGSKDGLVEAVYKEAINRHAERAMAASAQGTGRQRLLALIDASGELYGSRTPFYRLLTTLHLAATTSLPQLAPIARRVQQRQRDHMVALVQQGQRDGSIDPRRDAEALGLTINAALEGFLVQQLEPAATQARWIARFRHLMEDVL
ncbi:TetR/AcrR family transcriptional regulator [Conexibacter sp. SYSU D00693]|uniref:TetR/AcrR family transcriptional regulator n=1 Tax=Conexibacter sp. SYSU D00693 TaxID=2812560 RepID=UPI00196B6C48|nr:TetR/AcrR family transcriptional regulator [Conexibacter sp. SYSU D00693]